MPYKKQLTKEQALQKLRHYCGYQERCHSEIREKLFDLGVQKLMHDEIIATLIEENYLNEERFAIAFAGGKFRIKHWGKIKIKHELRQRQLSDYCIRKALSQIEPGEYYSVLKKQAAEKYQSLRGTNPIHRKKKTMDYLAGRGFESEMIRTVVNEF